MDGDKSKRTYTPAQRKEALALYEEHGPAEASRRTGIPSPTIRTWAMRDGRTTRVPPSHKTRAATGAARRSWAEHRLELAAKTGAVADELLGRILAARRASDVRALATGFAALVEKGQLLDGGATERVELSEAERIERVRALRDQLAERRAAKGA